MASSRFSKPVEMHQDEEFEQARVFSINRRLAGLNVNTGHISGSNVVTVTDEPDQLEDAVRAAGADLLGQQYGYARAALARHALRPSSHGAGRDRWR